MADVTINKRQLAQVQKKLLKMGGAMVPILKDSVDLASEAVANHAKGKHFQVGTGVGSSAKAKAHEFTFKNPDGSLRFKIRTNNLVESIQTKESKVVKGIVQGQVFAGEKYAERVEEGGPGTRAFPFMKPAAEATRPQFIKIIRKQVADFIRRQRGKG